MSSTEEEKSFNSDQKTSNLKEENINDETWKRDLHFGYPKAVYCIILTEFCERFSFCGLRTILSLYLRNELLVPEKKATIVYHVFIMLCYIGPLMGAFLADGYLGRFKTILYFSIIYLIGNIVMCLSAIPPLQLPPLLSTLIGLVLIALGTGGIKPCVAAFGGDQFLLPEEEKKLQGFFSWFYFAINTGGLAGMLATPVLRKAITCFNDDTCYTLGFGFPAALMVLSLIVFVIGKPWYKIRMPKNNMLLNFFRCTFIAVKNKMKNRKSNLENVQVRKHWLEYSDGSCGKKLIDEMKVVYAIMFLYIPLPLFWSLFDQQGSRWTFQASRTNGTISCFGKSITILADQMQVVNPAIVLIMIPIFERIIYPYCNILQSPLRRMVAGGIAAGAAFLASGILEVQLQATYPTLPPPGYSSINIINTLDCTVNVRIKDHTKHLENIVTMAPIRPLENRMFQNISAHNATRYICEVHASGACPELSRKFHSIVNNILEMQVHTILVGKKDDGSLFLYVTDPVDFSKSLNGKPRLRVAYMHGANDLRNVTVTLKSITKPGVQDVYFVADAPKDFFSLSSYMDLSPGKYTYEIKSTMDYINDSGGILLELGGVYSLVIREFRGTIDFTGLYTMSLPNSIGILWLLPQYFLISIGEIMFAISGLEFSFCQAPISMKAIIIASWYLTVAFGNLLVILITQAALFRKQSYEFFMFAGLMFADMALFAYMALKYVTVPLDESGISPEGSKIQLNDLGRKPDNHKSIFDPQNIENAINLFFTTTAAHAPKSINLPYINNTTRNDSESENDPLLPKQERKSMNLEDSDDSFSSSNTMYKKSFPR